MLKIKGYFSDNYALEFIEYSYRVPEYPRPQVTMRSLYPNRVNAYREYPRDTAMYLPTIAYHERVDYEIHIDNNLNEPFQKIVSLWLIPNEFTQAKEKTKIFEEYWSEQALFSITSKDLEHEILQTIFTKRWKHAPTS